MIIAIYSNRNAIEGRKTMKETEKELVQLVRSRMQTVLDLMHKEKEEKEFSLLEKYSHLKTVVDSELRRAISCIDEELLQSPDES